MATKPARSGGLIKPVETLPENQNPAPADEPPCEAPPVNSEIPLPPPLVGSFTNAATKKSGGDRSVNEYRKRKVELCTSIDRLITQVVLATYNDEELQKKLIDELKVVNEKLDKLPENPNETEGSSYEDNLGQIDFDLHRIQAQVKNELRYRADEKRLSWVVPLLVLLYIALIIYSIIQITAIEANNKGSETVLIPVIGVPAPVLIWAGIGSIAAILYRFYNGGGRAQVGERIEQKNHLQELLEIRWLIARPIIGVIMGGLSYLAITSGLFILGAGAGLVVDTGAGGAGGLETASAVRPEIMWLFSFLAGFSDKIYEGIIEFVAGRLPAWRMQGQAGAAQGTNKAVK